MMQNRKNLIILAVVVLIVIVGGVILIKNALAPAEQQVSMEEPVDVVLNFYDSWSTASRDADSDPYQQGLAEDPILSRELSDKLLDARDGIDPVLCQTSVSGTTATRVSYEIDDEVQIVVFSRDEGHNRQSVVTLNKLNGGWYISDISCSDGEFGEEKEFSFEKDGYILKSSELGNEIYFIFAEDGVFGQAAPLLFGFESVCRSTDGEENVCNPDSFGEKTGAIVRGQLTEAGVDVEEVEFVEGPLSFE